MGQSKIKILLSSLSLEDQRELILIFHHWMNLQTRIAIQNGEFQASPDKVATVTSIPKETLEMLELAVSTGDASGSLKAGVTEIVRSLPLMQKGGTGATLNHFFKKNLKADVFRQLYLAANLDVEKIAYDTRFPSTF